MSTEHDFGAQRKRDVLKMFVMIIRLKYFCDSLNIVVILASGHEFFSAVFIFLSHLLNEIKQREIF